MIRRIYAAAVVCGMLYAVEPAWAGDVRVGVGAHYWTAVDSVDADNVDEDGFSYYASAQFAFSDYVKLEADVEWFDKGFGGATEEVYAPEAFLVLGDVLYAAAGVGVYYSDGDFADDPFYSFRAGLDIPLLPILRLDINANYRFENWDSLSDHTQDIDSNTLTLGAAVRLDF
jgi:hypothetical protein